MSWSLDIETSFEKTWSFSIETLNMTWSPDIQTSFGENMEFLYTNTEYALIARYSDLFQRKHGVSVQKHSI